MLAPEHKFQVLLAVADGFISAKYPFESGKQDAVLRLSQPLQKGYVN